MPVCQNDQVLLWSTLDAAGVVTSSLGHRLHELLDAEGSQSRWLRARSNEHLLQLATINQLGLVLWCVADESQLLPICQSLCAVREQSPHTICVAYAEVPRWELLSVLIEAVAQMVFRDIPSLQGEITRAVRAVPRSSQDLHPLTKGLIERLPWADE